MIERVTYVFDKEPKVRHFIYGLLVGFSFLLAFGVPILLGYMSRIINEEYENSESTTVPNYRPFKNLVKDGGNVVILALLSFGLPVSGIAFLNNLINSTNISEVSLQEIWILAISSGSLAIMSILGIFVFPAFLIHYSVVKGTWRNTYALSNIKTMIVSVSYLVTLLKFLLYSSAFGTLSLLTTNSVILLPISGLLMFAYGGTIGKLFGDYATNNQKRISS